MTGTGDLPGHERSTDIQQHQSSFHTHTGTLRICKACPGTLDGTAKKVQKVLSLLAKKSLAVHCESFRVPSKHVANDNYFGIIINHQTNKKYKLTY